MTEDKRSKYMNTVSIAELYEAQGLTMDALSVYYHLKEKDPENSDYQSKIDALESRAVTEKEKSVVNLLHEWFEVLIPEERAEVLNKIKKRIKKEV